jgi:uroporphyrinogen decarboxylase
MNLYDHVISSESRMAAPIAGYPGLRLTGHSAREALSDATLQLECLDALEKRLRPDIAFPFLDLTILAEAMGMQVDFREKKKPALSEQAIPALERFYELGIPDPEKSGRMPVFLRVAEGLAEDKERMSAAFTTGPLTLLAQLMGADTLLEELRGGNVLEQAMAFATGVVGEYAAALAVRSNMVWVIDPAAGALTEPDFQSVYRPYISGLAGIIRGFGAVGVLHICAQVSHLLESMAFCGYDALSVDSVIDLPREAERLPKSTVLIGNIDGRRIVQRGRIEDVRWETRRLLRSMAGARNFILSTSCDVPADVPIRNLEALVEETHSWKSRSSSL